VRFVVVDIARIPSSSGEYRRGTVSNRAQLQLWWERKRVVAGLANATTIKVDRKVTHKVYLEWRSSESELVLVKLQRTWRPWAQLGREPTIEGFAGAVDWAGCAPNLLE